ncbi:MAG: Phytoene dehydrogenase, partial [uncultured Blastococcus sp.]
GGRGGGPGRAGRGRTVGGGRPRRHGARAVGAGRREARPVRAGRPRVRHRPEPGHRAAGLPRPVRRDRGPAGGPRRPRAPGPRRRLPVRRRHAADPAGHRRGRPRRAGAGARERDGRTVDGAHGAGRSHVADQRAALPPPSAARRGDAGPAGPQSGGRDDDRAVADVARARQPAAGRPPAADAAGPLRDVLRLRPAAGSRGARHRALRRAVVRLLVRAGRPAPAGAGGGRARRRVRRRDPHRQRRAPGARRGRPRLRRRAARRGAGAGRRRRLRRRRDGAVRRPAAARPAHPRHPARPGRRHPVAVGSRAAARPGRPHTGAGTPHRAVPGGLRRGVRRRVRDGPVPRFPPAGRRPDGLRQRAGRPGAASGRGQRVLVRPGERAAARSGPRNGLGRARPGRPVRRRAARRAGATRPRRPVPGALVRGPDAGRPRPRHRQRRRIHLRLVQQRHPRGLPASGERLPGAGALPRRRLCPPGWRTAAGDPVGGDRRRPRRARL